MKLKKILHEYNYKYPPQRDGDIVLVIKAFQESLEKKLKEETNFQVQSFIKKLIEELNEDNQ